jgi:hypothetical protein
MFVFKQLFTVFKARCSIVVPWSIGYNKNIFIPDSCLNLNVALPGVSLTKLFFNLEWLSLARPFGLFLDLGVRPVEWSTGR